MSPDDVLAFWFSEDAKPLWFNSNAAFDEELSRQFESLYKEIAANEHADWRQTPAGCVASVIVLDQFPLNMYRGRPESFTTEAQARTIADEAVTKGFDTDLPGEQKAFLYMPFMHSENLDDQNRGVALFEKAGLKDNLKFAKHHRDLIVKFGRFPHRNAILGRPSTPDELAYLASDEAFKG